MDITFGQGGPAWKVNLVIGKDEELHKMRWFRRRIRKFNRWWELHFLLIKTLTYTEREEEKISDWKVALDEYQRGKTRPIIYLPVSPRRMEV